MNETAVPVNATLEDIVDSIVAWKHLAFAEPAPAHALGLPATICLVILGATVLAVLAAAAVLAVRRSMHNPRGSRKRTRLSAVRYYKGPRVQKESEEDARPTLSTPVAAAGAVWLAVVTTGCIVWVIAEWDAKARISAEQDRVTHLLLALDLLAAHATGAASARVTLPDVPSSDAEPAFYPLVGLCVAAAVASGAAFALVSSLWGKSLQALCSELDTLSTMDVDETRAGESRMSSFLCEFKEVRTAIALLESNLAEYKMYLPEAVLIGGQSIASPFASPAQRGLDASVAAASPIPSETLPATEMEARVLSWADSGAQDPSELPGWSPHSHSIEPPQGEYAFTPPPASYFAVVFVDAWGANNMWRSYQAAMTEAMSRYTDTVRDLLLAHDGVEVKTVGDAFMLVFDDACSAVQFGIDLHEEMLQHDWPIALADTRFCERQVGNDGKVVWNGPRLRVGVSYGAVNKEQHAITGQPDYFGKTVHRAARLEATGIPGTVNVSSEVISQLQHRMKGLHLFTDEKGQTQDTALLSQALMGRSHDIEKAIVERSVRRSITTLAADLPYQKPPRPPVGSTWSVGQTGDVPGPSHSGSDALKKLDNVVVGRVRIVCVEDVLSDRASGLALHLNEALSCLLASLRATGGHITSVLGTSAAVWWGGSTASNTGVLRFPTLLSTKLQGVELLSTHVGLCRGTVLYGCIGATDSKHIQVIGQPVGVSGLLSQTAVELDVVGLMTYMQPQPKIYRENLRPIDEWQMQDGKRLAIFEMMKNPVASDGRMITLSHTIPMNLFCPEPTDASSPQKEPSLQVSINRRQQAVSSPASWGWSEEYTVAFYARDFAKIRAKSSDHELDPVLQIVSHLLESETHLRQALHMGLLQ